MDAAAQKLGPDGSATLSVFRGQAESGSEGLILCHSGLTQFIERSLNGLLPMLIHSTLLSTLMKKIDR